MSYKIVLLKDNKVKNEIIENYYVLAKFSYAETVIIKPSINCVFIAVLIL